MWISPRRFPAIARIRRAVPAAVVTPACCARAVSRMRGWPIPRTTPDARVRLERAARLPEREWRVVAGLAATFSRCGPSPQRYALGLRPPHPQAEKGE